MNRIGNVCHIGTYHYLIVCRSLRKARMTGKELRRSARKPWQPIAALLGISFTMPSTAASASAAPLLTGRPPTPQPLSGGTSSSIPFDMSTTGGGGSNRQLSNQSPAPPHIGGTSTMSSRTSGGSGSGHH